MIIVLVLFCREGSCQQFRTLGGFGAGGMNGQGFGDPVVNDYAGIEWRQDFQVALMNGYNYQAAQQYATKMSRIRNIINGKYNRQYGSPPVHNLRNQRRR